MREPHIIGLGFFKAGETAECLSHLEFMDKA